MRSGTATRTLFLSLLTLGLVGCGGSQPADPAGPTTGQQTTAPVDTGDAAEPAEKNDAAADAKKKKRKQDDAGEFAVGKSDKSKRPTQGKLKATNELAAVRFFVVNKEKGPIKGIVISLTGPDGKKFYTGESDDEGFAEVLVPIGKTYKIVFLSLGRRDIAAKVKVANEPRLNLKLTMRYNREEYEPMAVAPPAKDEPAPAKPAPRFVLENVHFPTGKATLTEDSHAQLDGVVEYMMYKKSARIEISGHTDNVGKKKKNKALSQKRADAVRAYLVSKGIDGSRIEAIGHGSEKPLASNKTKQGRQQNRRIEAREL